MASAKKPKKITVRFRASDEEVMKMQWCANTYANGNLSKWLRYASANAERRKLHPKKSPA